METMKQREKIEFLNYIHERLLIYANKNGRIQTNDVIKLFDELEGQIRITDVDE